MPKKEEPVNFLHDFKIDKLTDSILNTVSGDSFQTEVQRLTKPDMSDISKNMDGILTGKRSCSKMIRRYTNLSSPAAPLSYRVC